MLAVRMLESTNAFKTFLINTNGNDLNLFTIASSPAKKGKFRFVIAAGTTIGHVVAAAAITIGQFPAGSEIEIYNNGSIQGRAGTPGVWGGTTTGGAGGNVLKADYPNQTVRIYNSGEMKAGGGGGGCGGSGGAGGNGGRGNIIATTGYEQPRSEVEWYIFDGSPNDNHVSWFGTGGSDSNGPGETLMIAPPGLFEKGDYWGHTQDANPHNSWYVRLHTLNPAGVGASTNAGGTGGYGAGFNQVRGNGQTGAQSQTGTDPGNGSGKGGSSGNAGIGGNGADWGQDGTVGNAGNVGGAGNSGVYEGGNSGSAGGNPFSAGLGGSYLVKGAASVTLTNTGTIIGRLT